MPSVFSRAAAATVVVSSLVASSVVAADWSASSTAPVGIDEPAACCELAERLDPPNPPGSVAIIGDSLFVGITDSRFIGGPSTQSVLQQRGISAWATTRVSMTITSARQVVRDRAPLIASTDLVVIGLGTNDIVNSGGSASSAWAASITALVDEIRRVNPSARVVWVDLSFNRFAARAADFNAVLRAFAAGSANTSVCDWSGLIATHPEWLGGDGLHLNGSGYLGRRNLVLDCISSA